MNNKRKMNKLEIESRLGDIKRDMNSHKSNIEELKQERKQLKKQLEELPKLEVGKWYKFDLSLMFVKNKPTNNNVIGLMVLDYGLINIIIGRVIKTIINKPQTKKYKPH